MLFYIVMILSKLKNVSSFDQPCTTIPSQQDTVASSTDVGSHVAVLWSGAIPSKLKRTLFYVLMFSVFKTDTLLWYMLIHFFILPLTSLLCHLIYNVVGIVVSFHLVSKDQWSQYMITKTLQKGHFFPLQCWSCLRGREASGWKMAFPTVIINTMWVLDFVNTAHTETPTQGKTSLKGPHQDHTQLWSRVGRQEGGKQSEKTKETPGTFSIPNIGKDRCPLQWIQYFTLEERKSVF